jgi:hypothetical protein
MELRPSIFTLAAATKPQERCKLQAEHRLHGLLADFGREYMTRNPRSLRLDCPICAAPLINRTML